MLLKRFGHLMLYFFNHNDILPVHKKIKVCSSSIRLVADRKSFLFLFVYPLYTIISQLRNQNCRMIEMALLQQSGPFLDDLQPFIHKKKRIAPQNRRERHEGLFYA